MLDTKQIEVIKSTIPILEDSGEALTQHFYTRMFKGHPQVKEFFNIANQHAGTQQGALAASICACAKNIDNPKVLVEILKPVAQKHASLRIQPEHYPIVGEHLLGSIQELLKIDSKHPIIDAWTVAYALLTEIIVDLERNIYNDQQEKSWSGFKPLKVTRKVQESDVITSFYLQNENGSLPRFKPGQYITVRVPGTEKYSQMRNYSLSSEAGEDYYRISVKRESALAPESPDGYVSTYLHEKVDEGDYLESAPACGSFFLDLSKNEEKPLVLLSGGVGITPLLSMVHTALSKNIDRKIFFVHCALNGFTHSFRNEVKRLAQDNSNLHLHVRYSEPTENDLEAGHCNSVGYIDSTLLLKILPGKDGDFYFCGPKPFMGTLFRCLKDWGVPFGQIHFEFFGPMQSLENEN